jgi:kynurenine formamidase
MSAMWRRRPSSGAEKIESELDRLDLDIRQGDTVLFHTGHYAKFYGTPEYATHQPGLNKEATEYIIDKGAINFGVDNTSPDMFLDKTYPCHMVCRAREVTHMENLCNLEKLIGKRFTFVALPLRIRKGTGSPIRAVAILSKDEPVEWHLDV